MPFYPQNWKKNLKKFRVGYVYIEESFDTIFNMGYRSEGVQHPAHGHGLWVGKIAHGLEG